MGFSIQDYLKNNKIEMGNIKKEVGDTPYKGGHNDIRKTNYEVKIKADGKLDLYTHKTIMTEGSLNEASRIDFNELNPNDKSIVTQLQKHFNAKINSIFDGIHGRIVDLRVNNVSGGYTFDTKDLQFLAKMNIRWMENDGNSISIGF